MFPAQSAMPSIPFYQNKSFNNIAHGTGRELLPGNTLEGAINAVAVGADIIELDVHLTLDKIVVVRHDKSVDTTTNGSGLIAGIRIPPLESLFIALPDKRFLIELKPDDTETGVQLCRLVLAYGLQDQVLVGSFHSLVLQNFRQVCPQVPTSLGEEEARLLVVLSWIGLGHLYKSPGYSVQLPFKYYGIPLVSRSLIKAASELNVALDVWTINDPQEMLRMMSLGVDGIITDRPDILQAIDI